MKPAYHRYDVKSTHLKSSPQILRVIQQHSSTQIWHMDTSKECAGQVCIWLCPFYFKNDIKFSVSVHYLPSGITHSTLIWHMDTSKKCAGQVCIWSWFDDFWQSYAPFTLKII
jgi:hypothetical protein